MARVLVTAIGTGKLIQVEQGSGLSDSKPSRQYSKATYIIDRSEYTTEFIAEALIRHYRIDRVFMVGTAKSMWEQVYYTFSEGNRDDDYYLELAQAIDDSDHARYRYDQDFLKKVELAMDQRLGRSGSRCFLIRYGLNNKELLNNFQIFLEIANLLQDGDEVYVDITHSFRSLAIFQYMMLGFIENLPGKQVKLKGILYGMLDVAQEMNGKAPVINLSMVDELNRWIRGIHDLDEYGNGYLVADLLQEQYPELAGSIRDLSDRININYLKDIRNERGQALWRHLGHPAGPGSVATRSLDRFLKMFTGEERESFFELKVARWHFQKKRYATGYITLTEAMITRLCEVLGYDCKKYGEREEAKKRMWGLNKDYENLFTEVNAIRRQVAHFQGGSHDQYRDAIKRCSKYCDRAESLFKKIGKEFLK